MSNSKVVRLQAVMLVGYGGKLPEGDREKLFECVMSKGLFITDWHNARLLKGNNLNICCELFGTIEYFAQADQLE
ncbi:hypothetical protein EAI_07611 [Harpegnathos saltator]|uniref:Uncharacterized protein n=1 Tax=Harpegnathos saltator TaxID=610380 RepID=E2C468_HARSA|nr:hypothetical protein EAI_07611 [Harpegnathos saltator]